MIKTKMFGYIALLLNLTYKIPQIIKLYKTKQSIGISLKSLLLGILTCIFYAIHGFIIKDIPLILTGLLTLIQAVVLVYLYSKCNNNKIKKELNDIFINSIF